jgi:hypothetical protein
MLKISKYSGKFNLLLRLKLQSADVDFDLKNS